MFSHMQSIPVDRRGWYLTTCDDGSHQQTFQLSAWSQILFMSTAYLQSKYNITHRHHLISSTEAQRTITHKVCCSLACWQCCAVCLLWVWLVLSHCCPSGCTARAEKKSFSTSVCYRQSEGSLYLSACTCVLISIHTFVCMCAYLCRGTAQTWALSSDNSKRWLLTTVNLSKWIFF